MKSPLTILLIISYLAIGVFGIFGMHTQAGMGMEGYNMATSNCIAAITKGVVCPKEAGPIDFVLFHIDSYKGFSLATFGDNVMNALLLVFASLLFIGLVFLSPHLFKPPLLAFYRYQFKNSFSPTQKQQLTRWLALHENSPSFV